MLIPKRKLKDNIRNVLDILEYLDKHNEKQDTDFCFIFLDAEEAFDNLNSLKFWKRIWNFGNNFFK